MTDWNALPAKLYDGSFRQMFIDGAWYLARSGKVMDTRNPANGALLATVPQGDCADLDRAAHKAFEGPWANHFGTASGTDRRLSYQGAD